VWMSGMNVILWDDGRFSKDSSKLRKGRCGTRL
jgi:hypothetical protein